MTLEQKNHSLPAIHSSQEKSGYFFQPDLSNESLNLYQGCGAAPFAWHPEPGGPYGNSSSWLTSGFVWLIIRALHTHLLSCLRHLGSRWSPAARDWFSLVNPKLTEEPSWQATPSPQFELWLLGYRPSDFCVRCWRWKSEGERLGSYFHLVLMA